MVFISFFFCFFFSVFYASGYTDHPDPPVGRPHRNSGFHSAGYSAAVIRDWIFSSVQSMVHQSDDSPVPPSSKPRSVSLPLYGSVHATAYWFADVYLGSPHSQVQSLMVDTGSSVLGFPCSDCQKCGAHIDSPYNKSESRSVKPVKCVSRCPLCAAPKPTQFSGTSSLMSNHSPSTSQQCAYQVYYTEGSYIAGTFYEDVFSFGQNPFHRASAAASSLSVSIPFGCHSKETQLFRSQDASGVLGMEATSRFGPVAFVTSVLADLLDLKKVQGGFLRDLGLSTENHTQTSDTEPVLAMCISQNGGILTIGASTTQYHTSRDEEDALVAYADRTEPSEDESDKREDEDEKSEKDGQTEEEDLIHSPQTDCSTIRQTQQSQQQPSNPSMDNSLRWTPFVLDPEVEGGWPGSYVVILQGWTVRGTATGSSVLAIPSSPQPLHTRTSQASGYPALVDSGTTTTDLPFLLYTHLWTALMKNIATAKRARRRKLTATRDTDSGSGGRTIRIKGIRKVSGASLTMMQEKLDAYIEGLMETQRKATERTPGRHMRETASNVEQGRETTTRFPDKEMDRELKLAEGVRREMQELGLLLKEEKQFSDDEKEQFNDDVEQQPMDIAESLLDSDDDTAEREATKRSFREGVDDSLQGARPLRRLVPVSVRKSDEECWYLSEEDNDLSYFPDMVLQFANHMDHVWRPTSYLYRKGKARVYCLSIVLEHDESGRSALDAHQSNEEPREQQFDSRSRRREQNVKLVVLGSTFFIHHDIVFHLGRWEMSSREALCPSTRIRKT